MSERFPNVSFNVFSMEVTSAVERLVAADKGDDQNVDVSDAPANVDFHSIRFFRNPFYVHGAAEAPPAPPGRRLASREAAHFLDMAGGHVSGGPHAVRFTGRATELARLTSWVSDVGGIPLYLVSGRPGSGKSALLAVVVCAIHPDLASPTHDHAATGLRVHPRVAAIDARHRDVSDFEKSIYRQLFGASDVRGHGVLAERLRHEAETLIVVDGLDEAMDPVRVVEDLLLPLAALGTVRILVSARTDTAVDTRIRKELAPSSDDLIDLDTTDVGELRSDLDEYARSLFKTPDYDGEEFVGPVAHLAHALARTLTERREELAWGEFLVTRMYVRYVVDNQLLEPDDEEARELGRDVRLDLVELFELDPTVAANQGWNRPVLAALAYAGGEGLPTSGIPVFAEVFAKVARKPSDVDVSKALSSLRHYLRMVREIRPDGTSVVRYQIFHDGLAAYLLERPFGPQDSGTVSAADLERALVDSVPRDSDGRREWHRTSAYLRNAVLDQAVAAGTLSTLLCEPGYVVSGIELATIEDLADRVSSTDPARALLDACAAVLRLVGSSPVDSRHATRLALAALDHGSRPLARSLARWGDLAVDPVCAMERGVEVVTPATRSMVAVASTGMTIEVLDVDGDDRVRLSLDAPVNCLCLGEIGNVPILVAGLGNHKVSTWRMDRAKPQELSLHGHLGLVRAVTIARRGGRTAIVTGNDDGVVRFWDPRSRAQVGEAVSVSRTPICGLICVPLESGEDAVLVGARDRLAVIGPGGGVDAWRKPADVGKWVLYAHQGLPVVLRISPRGEVTVRNMTDGSLVPVPEPVPSSSWPPPDEITSWTVVDGVHLVCSRNDHSLMRRSLVDGEVRAIGVRDRPVVSMDALRLGGTGEFVVATQDGSIERWQIDGTEPVGSTAVRFTPKIVTTLTGSTRSRRSDRLAAAHTSGGLVIATRTADGTIHAHVVSDTEIVERSLCPGRTAELKGIAAGPGWAAVVIQDTGGTLRALHPETGDVLADSVTVPGWFVDNTPELLQPSRTRTWAVRAGVMTLLTGLPTGALQLSTTSGDGADIVLEAHDGEVTAVAAWQTNNHLYAVSGSATGVVRLWDLDTLDQTGDFVLDEPVRGITVLSPDRSGPDHILITTTRRVVVVAFPRVKESSA